MCEWYRGHKLSADCPCNPQREDYRATGARVGSTPVARAVQHGSARQQTDSGRNSPTRP
jgi:hypothetical protein